MTRHVDISTGKVFSTVTDVVFSRPLALAIARTYDSSRVERTGLFGVGWFSLFDVHFTFTPHKILLQDVEGRILSFPLLAIGESHFDLSEKLTLLRQEDCLQLTTEPKITYTFHRYEEHWRLSQITDEKNNVITLTYEDQQLSVKDAKNHLYRFVYDQNERLITAVYRDPSATPLRRYHYDELHRLVSVEDELSTPVSYRYDDQHRLIEHSKPNGYVFYYQYDDSGRCIKNWGSDGAHTRELKHFPAEQKTEVIDSRGNKTVYYYNHAGLTTAITNPDGTTRHYTYDAYRQLILEVDENQAVTRYEYNPAGKLTARIDADNHKWEMLHEADAVTQIDPLGNRVTQTKQGEDGFIRTDQQGNRQVFKLPDYVKQRHYDDWQRLAAVEDKLGHKTQYEYDVKGNLVGIVDKKGQRTAFGYDKDDNLVWTQDPLGYQRRFVYRGLADKVAQYDENYHAVQFDYDTEGNLTTLTNENGVPHHFTYDHSDRVVASQGFDGHTTRYAYDAVGNVTEIRHADGSELALTYDKVGRITAIHGTDEHGLTCHQQYHYDAAGRLVTAENEYATVRFEYDGLGRLIKEYQNNQVVERRYDDQGHYVARRSPWGTEIRFAYDANAQLIEMGLTAEKVIGYRLDALGRPLNRFLPGGTHADYTYDEIGNLLSQTIQNHDNLFIQRRYEYDARHKLSRLQDKSRLEKRFAYDPAGRLQQVTYANNSVEQFAYDPAGNLLNQEARYDQGNRLLRFNGYAYEHDARGNLIRKTSAAGTVEYRYNIFNQLIAAQTPQHGLVEFQYDALGRRILKKSQHREVRYYWNQLELFGEIEADEPIEYVFHNFAPVATLRKGQIYYYHTDHLGTPLEMTDERGRLVWKGDYVTLGRCRGQGEVVNRLRFPGQWEDEETGLHFNVFRYYDAEVGRYVTVDPIGYDGGDWNLYRYVENDLINLLDRLGLGEVLPCDEKLGEAIRKQANLFYGTSTKDGPGNGRVACAYSVNKVLKNAGITPLGKNPNLVDSVKEALKNGRGMEITDPTQYKAGDLAIIGSGEKAHIGICLDNGCTKVLSNSRSLAIFKWISKKDFHYKGGPYNKLTSQIWRVCN